MLKRALKWAGIIVAMLVVVGGVLFEFGGMMPPSAAAKTAYAAQVAAGTQPAVQSRLVIPIPGCVCHSSDPVLQVQHSVRRMSECSGCHDRG